MIAALLSWLRGLGNPTQAEKRMNERYHSDAILRRHTEPLRPSGDYLVSVLEDNDSG